MDLRHLRSFIAVAEELSFRRAAERMRLSQPPLSRQIRALEEELGVRLLERDRRKRVSLTDAGHAFLTDARRTIASAEEGLQHAREAGLGSRGRLNLANIAALSTRVVPPLLTAFRAEYPLVEVFLVELERTEQAAALREGRIHLGIYPDLCAPRTRQFQSQSLFSCPMVAVLPPQHALAKKNDPEIDIEALAGETVLIPSPKVSPGYMERLNHSCAAANFTPTALHPVDGVLNLLGMVNAGYGVAILPEVLVSVHNCRTRRLRAPVPHFRLKLIWLRNAPSLVLQNFLAVAKRLREKNVKNRET